MGDHAADDCALEGACRMHAFGSRCGDECPAQQARRDPARSGTKRGRDRRLHDAVPARVGTADLRGFHAPFDALHQRLRRGPRRRRQRSLDHPARADAGLSQAAR